MSDSFQPLTVECLPRSIQDVGEVLGMPLTLKLIHHFGGLELKVPHRLKENHPILVALGKEDGDALCKFVGGGELYVPRMTSRRRRDVQALAEAGMSRAEIARALGMAQRHVRRLANGLPKKADNQPDLFSE